MFQTATTQKLSYSNKFGTGNFITDSRAEQLREWAIANQDSKQVVEMMSRDPNYIPLGPVDPWHIPDGYGATPEELAERDEKLHKFETDATVAADLAMRYRLRFPFDPATPSDLAAGVVRVLSAWSTVDVIDNSTGGSVLNWNEFWSVYIQAAMLIRGADEFTEQVESNFKDATLRFHDALSCAYSHFNNWSTFGIATTMATASLVGDRRMFDSAVYRWRDQFNDSIVSGFVVNNGGPAQGQVKNNIPKYEIYRQGANQGNGSSGLNYATHDLNGKVLAAEWARLNGVWLYDHVSPDGSTLRGLCDNLAEWTSYGKDSSGVEDRDVLWFNTSDPPVGFSFVARPSWAPIIKNIWYSEPIRKTSAKTLAGDNQGIRLTSFIYLDRPLVG